MDAKTHDLGKTAGSIVYETTRVVDKVDPMPSEKHSIQSNWINLKSKGMLAWFRREEDKLLNRGDYVMIRSGRSPELFGESWRDVWVGPYVVGNSTDPRIMTL